MMKRQVSWLALSAGLVAASGGTGLAWAQGTEVERSETEVKIETKSDTTDTVTTADIDVERRAQENISAEGFGIDNIELVIRLLGAKDFDGTSSRTSNDSGSGADDGYSSSIHRLADQINAAYDAGDDDQVLALIQEDSLVREARPEVNVLEAWSLHRSGSALKALARFEEIYAASPLASNAAGILFTGMKSERFSRVYGIAEKRNGPLGQILLPDGAKDLTLEDQKEIRKVRVGFLNAWLSAALKYQRSETANRVSKLLRAEGIEPNTAPTLVGLGWIAHNKGDYTASMDLFAQVQSISRPSSSAHKDALYGQALGLRATGQKDKAFALASRYRAQDKRMGALHRDLVLAQAYSAYDEGRFDESWALAQQAYATDATSRQAKMLSAWSHYKLGEYDRAASLFKDLYESQPDAESADGLRASLEALGRPLAVSSTDEGQADSVLSLASQDGVDEVYPLNATERAFYRGHYLLAARSDPAQFGHLEETGIRWIGGGVRYQFRDGEKGLGELTTLSEKIGMAWSNNLDHFKVEIEFANLDAGGAPSVNRPIGAWKPGDGPTAFVFTTQDDIVTPTFSWNREGPIEFDLSLGASAIGGEVSASVVGHFDITLHNEARQYTIGGHRTSVAESVLSRSGAIDPVTGVAFGGVVETGIHASTYLPIDDKWSATGGLSWGERTGKNVQDNSHFKASIGLGYDLGLADFSYFSIGPVYRYDQFDENLSEYTFGHGGYYSPEWLHHAGIEANFMTQEGSDWLIKGSVNAGYEKASQEANVFYPLGPPVAPDNHSGSESSGLGVSAWAQGAWRLSNRWILEGGAYANRNDDYSEGAIFLKFRYSFGDRTAVYSSDLTEDLYQPY